MRVIFVLPSAGGGGGAHSIVQEVIGLRRHGVAAAIATPRSLAAQFQVRYPELQRAGVDNPDYGKIEDLGAIIETFDLAIATTALSARTVVHAKQASNNSALKLGYYIQDYEPLFYPPGSREWSEAAASFDLMKDALLFAKTDWLCTVVEANHNVAVRRVKASIDHDIYHPLNRDARDPIRITAMVRPKTPRRAPKRTIRILEQIAAKYGSRASISFFGCEPIDLASVGLRPSPQLVSLGVLDRNQVASTLRYSDLFLDLSDFQAFGRTGLEGMACGCIPVLPVFGGTSEYAENGINAYVVDTRSDADILSAVDQFFNARPHTRDEMRNAAIYTSLNYSVAKAAYSELELFKRFIGDSASTPVKTKSKAA